VRRHAGALYFWIVAVGGFSAAAAALVTVPELPGAAGPEVPGPVVTVTGPAPSASASASSPAQVGSHGSPGFVAVAAAPTVGLPATSATSTTGPTVLPSPPVGGTGSSPTATATATSSGTATSGQQGVTLAVKLTPTPAVGIGAGIAGLDLSLALNP
jgi:hypothetical protein